MQVYYPAGGLDPSTKADIASRLTKVLIAMEGGANTHGGRAFAWVLFTEVPTGDWWVGGETSDQFVSSPGKFLVHVTVPEGYMNGAHKSEVHAAVNEAILVATTGISSAEAPPVTGSSILVVIDEVPEGNWGAGGRTITIDKIADTVGLPKDGPRYAWVQAYFAAKARQFAAAGYPDDTGSLLPPQ